MRCILPVLAVLLLLTTPAGAQDSQKDDFLKGLEDSFRREALQLAEQGDVTAQFNLGVMYEDGQGVPQDYAEARKWYWLAAAQGEAAAQHNLGNMYHNGLGVPQDYAEALKWYRMAAAQGLGMSLANLGVMYSHGFGVPQDYVQAHMWLNLAAARGIKVAAEWRANVAARMTPADVSKAQRMAREWLAKHGK